MAPASAMWHLATVHPRSMVWQTLLDSRMVVVESLQTHTPLDPRADALVCAQEHGEELRQRWQIQPPPTPARSVQHAVPCMRNPTSGARGHAR